MSEALVLPEKLDLPAAGELLDALKARRGTDLGVDAQGVRYLGTNCLQVLLAARASWVGDGKSFEIEKMSDAFARDLAQFGLSPETFSDGSQEP